MCYCINHRKISILSKIGPKHTLFLMHFFSQKCIFFSEFGYQNRQIFHGKFAKYIANPSFLPGGGGRGEFGASSINITFNVRRSTPIHPSPPSFPSPLFSELNFPFKRPRTREFLQIQKKTVNEITTIKFMF